MANRDRRASDYGAVRRFGLAHAILAIVGISVAAIAITWNAARDRAAHVKTAQAWAVSGPPCPALTQAQFEQGRFKADKTFDYDGVTLGRRAGHASCSDVHENGGVGLRVDKVCQFTSPAVLTVKSKAGVFFFVPGVAQPATLVIHRDVPRCVMASHFTLDNAD